jgi:hypothetical protein
MPTLNENPTNPQFPPTTTCTACGHPFGSLPSPPPLPRPGSKFAAAIEKYLSARSEYYEACRRAGGESIRGKLEGAAPAAGSVG